MWCSMPCVKFTEKMWSCFLSTCSRKEGQDQAQCWAFQHITMTFPKSWYPPAIIQVVEPFVKIKAMVTWGFPCWMRIGLPYPRAQCFVGCMPCGSLQMVGDLYRYKDIHTHTIISSTRISFTTIKNIKNTVSNQNNIIKYWITVTKQYILSVQ